MFWDLKFIKLQDDAPTRTLTLEGPIQYSEAIAPQYVRLPTLAQHDGSTGTLTLGAFQLLWVWVLVYCGCWPNTTVPPGPSRWGT